ncbi:hypothetical protein AB0M23_15450 [Streptomyces sp. NPDC052077]|uniref:hypothetical protein n=1 Tax=Streptomyces sp. NPDC052077 TaxID=3154757 RepID=UPI0034169102
MGIESDQVVYEYLSRVGDVAQQRQLPSAARMRLVADLRERIDRHRSGAAADSPAAVRRILDGLGSPDDLVEAAGAAVPGAAGGAPPTPAPAVPVQRADEASAGRRDAGPRGAAQSPGAAGTGAAGPGAMAGERAERREWWRVEGPSGGAGGPFGTVGGPFGAGDGVPGFVGGVEIPELLRPPPSGDPDEDDAEDGGAPDGPGVEAAGGEPGGSARRFGLPRLRPAGGVRNPLLLTGAALLAAGALLGSLVPLGLGWLIAYCSRRLTREQSRWAVLGLPGTVAAASAVWLWGRADGRWGDPVAQGAMRDAVAETWPWTLRAAAVATALYLLWHARRQQG